MVITAMETQARCCGDKALCIRDMDAVCWRNKAKVAGHNTKATKSDARDNVYVSILGQESFENGGVNWIEATDILVWNRGLYHNVVSRLSQSPYPQKGPSKMLHTRVQQQKPKTALL